MKQSNVFLYDLKATQPNESGKFHGGGKYAKKVFIEVCRANKKWRLLAVYDGKKRLDSEISALCEQYDVGLLNIDGTTIVDLIRKYDVSRFYSALPEYMLSALESGCEFYGTVHGLRMLETRLSLHSLRYTDSLSLKVKYLIKLLFDNYFRKKDMERIRRYVVSNMKIIAVSRHTQYSLLNYFKNIEPGRIDVFYSPSVADYAYEATVLPAYLTEKGVGETNYFLLVSGNRWIKNNLRAITALDLLFEERSSFRSYKVIVTGVSNAAFITKRLRNPENFVFLDYVDEVLLDCLFRNAYALIYPSLNEGFGYPPLEAMRYGKPVIASPVTSISEICGDAVLYTNPFDVHEMKNRIMQLWLDSTIYEKYSTRGRLRYGVVYERQKDDLKALVNYLLNVDKL